MSDQADGFDPRLLEILERTTVKLEQSRFAKAASQSAVLDVARRLLMSSGGIEVLSAQIGRLDAAGIFAETDWQQPATLLPSLVRYTLEDGHRTSATIECLSLLRFLAIARGEYVHPGLPPVQAQHFLTQVLALNLNRLFGTGLEVERIRNDNFGPAITGCFSFLVNHIGYDDILESLIDEVWRILAQRPIQVSSVKAMVAQISVTMATRSHDIGEARLGADRLISALFAPTRGCQDDPGLSAYQLRLESMDRVALEQEAIGFARAMHDVGLVSDYHPIFLRWLQGHGHEELIPLGLGLSATGLDAFRCYHALVERLIAEAVHPQTAQAVYGLSLLLERGILHTPSIAPGLWRQISLVLSDQVRSVLANAFGTELAPRVYLIAGVISLLGQPLGIGQGNSPTCQSARALSMWSYSDPDFLLHLIAQAAQFDAVIMHFEGQAIDSSALPPGSTVTVPLDTDPVSMVMVPHIDRVYYQMGRLCVDRPEDPHRWINPELHGWWVGRNFMIAVDVATGDLQDFATFVRQFFMAYHPYYNGNQPLIHPQPAGVAVTDSAGRFVGWHAITIQRVALDYAHQMRVYFFNPNNDSGQDWGQGVIVSTSGNGEWFGESSLPFAQLTSRLYIYHDYEVVRSDDTSVPDAEIQSVMSAAVDSWAADRVAAADAAGAEST